MMHLFLFLAELVIQVIEKLIIKTENDIILLALAELETSAEVRNSIT